MKNTTEFAATASKLIFGQTYYYRAFASNASGQGWANASAQFTTLKPRVPATGADKLPVKAGLVCWFDAAVGVTADAKGVVQTWKDLSGNGHDASLASGAPVLAQNQIHAKPAVQFRTAAGGCALTLDGPLVTEQQFVVLRSPNAKWNSDGCAFGRRSETGVVLSVRPEFHAVLGRPIPEGRIEEWQEAPGAAVQPGDHHRVS